MIKVHEMVERFSVTAQCRYKVTFPCCGSDGILSKQQINKWQKQELRKCKACHDNSWEEAPVAMNAKETAAAQNLAKFNKLMHSLNHA